jgi:hypothetical protein
MKNNNTLYKHFDIILLLFLAEILILPLSITLIVLVPNNLGLIVTILIINLAIVVSVWILRFEFLSRVMISSEYISYFDKGIMKKLYWKDIQKLQVSGNFVAKYLRISTDCNELRFSISSRKTRRLVDRALSRFPTLNQLYRQNT